MKKKKPSATPIKPSASNPVNLKDVLRSPLIRFLGIFSAIMIAFYLVWWTDFFREAIVYPWNGFNARLSSLVLRVLGMGTTSEGMIITGKGSAISIKEGCDAIEPAMLFTAALLAFPAPWKNKLRGITTGVLILFTINQVRIVSLFLIEKYWPAAFEFMHIQFWQVVFILLAILLWILWMRTSSPKLDDSGLRT